MLRTLFEPATDPLERDYIAALIEGTEYHIPPSMIALLLRQRVPLDEKNSGMSELLAILPHAIIFYSDFLGTDLEGVKFELTAQKRHLFRRDHTSQVERHIFPIRGAVTPGMETETILDDNTIENRLSVPPKFDPKHAALFWVINRNTQTIGYPVKNIGITIEYRLVVYLPGAWRGEILEGSIMGLIYDSLDNVAGFHDSL